MNLYGSYVLGMNYHFWAQQIDVRLVAIKPEFNLGSAYTTFHFTRTLPLDCDRKSQRTGTMNELLHQCD